jgi:hypothetical protein
LFKEDSKTRARVFEKLKIDPNREKVIDDQRKKYIVKWLINCTLQQTLGSN